MQFLYIQSKADLTGDEPQEFQYHLVDADSIDEAYYLGQRQTDGTEFVTGRKDHEVINDLVVPLITVNGRIHVVE